LYVLCPFKAVPKFLSFCIVRSETKPLEHRSALTPSTTKSLIDAGYTVNVERSPVRIFLDEEYSAVGATLVPEGSWPDAPTDHLIIGKSFSEYHWPLSWVF